MYLWINVLDQKLIHLEVEGGETINSVKEKIQEIENIPAQESLLVYYGRLLDDESNLTNSNVRKESRVDLILKHVQLHCMISLDNIVTINACLTETVTQLKKELEKNNGITENEYALLFERKSLEDEQKLIYYGIKRDDIIELQFKDPVKMTISVRILDGKQIELNDVELYDKVETLKRRIENVENVSSDRQRMIFNNQQLVDSHTLAYYGIKDGSTIYLHLKFNDMQIAVQAVNQSIFVFHVDGRDIVESVKSKIEQRLQYPMNEQILVFGKKHLEDHFMLADYSILNRSAIYLCLRSIVINCNLSHNKTIKLKVEASDTIMTVKNKIQEQEPTMIVDDLILAYLNKPMKDKKMIFDYGLRNGCTIDMFYKTVQIFYKNAEGKTQVLDIESTETINSIRKKIETKENIKRDTYYVSYSAQILDDNKTPIQYMIRKESTLQLCFRLRGGL